MGQGNGGFSEAGLRRLRDVLASTSKPVAVAAAIR